MARTLIRARLSRIVIVAVACSATMIAPGTATAALGTISCKNLPVLVPARAVGITTESGTMSLAEARQLRKTVLNFVDPCKGDTTRSVRNAVSAERRRFARGERARARTRLRVLADQQLVAATVALNATRAPSAAPANAGCTFTFGLSRAEIRARNALANAALAEGAAQSLGAARSSQMRGLLAALHAHALRTTNKHATYMSLLATERWLRLFGVTGNSVSRVRARRITNLQTWFTRVNESDPCPAGKGTATCLSKFVALLEMEKGRDEARRAIVATRWAEVKTGACQVAGGARQTEHWQLKTPIFLDMGTGEWENLYTIDATVNFQNGTVTATGTFAPSSPGEVRCYDGENFIGYQMFNITQNTPLTGTGTVTSTGLSDEWTVQLTYQLTSPITVALAGGGNPPGCTADHAFYASTLMGTLNAPNTEPNLPIGPGPSGGEFTTVMTGSYASPGTRTWKRIS